MGTETYRAAVVRFGFRFFESYKKGDTVEEVVNYKPYFLGPFIVCQNKNTFSLIDGQQRLTSMTLLLIYLMEYFKETKEDLKDLVFMKNMVKHLTTFK